MMRVALAAVLLAAGVSGLTRASGATAPYTPSLIGVSGEQASTASAINSAGQIGGSTLAAGSGWHAFLRTAGGSVIDLGTLGSPYVNSFVVDLNTAGQVAGTAAASGPSGPQRGFFWSQATGMLDLGTIGADTIVEPVAINSDGQVAGTSWASDGPTHAFSWTRAGGMVDIGSLGGVGVRANDLNDSGQIVGISGRGRVTPPGPHAFVWSASSGMRDLGTLGGVASEAIAVNEQGAIAGWAMTTSQQAHAFLWTAGAGMRDLGTLGGSESRAVAISDSGLVIGTSTTATGATHAFSWTPADGIVDLGTAGGASSTPTGVSSSGLVVGYGTNAGGSERPLLWEGRAVVDLGSLTAPHGRALAINDRGEIVGYGHAGSGWEPKALLWARARARPVIGRPTASPSSPVAGRRFIVSFPVARSDTRARLVGGEMTSRVTVAGRRVPSTQSLVKGRARVTTLVPRAAGGQQLRVSVTIVLDAQSAARAAVYRIR